MTKEIVEAVGVLEREKGISADRLMAALEDALLSAYKKTPEAAKYARVEVDRSSGDFRVYELILPPDLEEQLLDEVEEEAGEPTVDPETGELVYPEPPEIDQERLMQYRDQIDERDVTPDDFGRIAAQTAKQVILQRIREAERDMMFNEYQDRVGELITGIVQQSDSRYTLVQLRERVEALLPRGEQVHGERYDHGQRDQGDHHRRLEPGQGAVDHRVAPLARADPRAVRAGGAGDRRRAGGDPERGARAGLSLEDRRGLARFRGRPGRRLRGPARLARAHGRVRAARREDRHHPLQRGAGAVCREGALARARARGARRRRGQAGHRDRARRPALAGDRQGRAERAAGRAADRVARGHPLGDGVRRGGGRDGLLRGGGRRPLRGDPRQRQALPERLAAGLALLRTARPPGARATGHRLRGAARRTGRERSRRRAGGRRRRTSPRPRSSSRTRMPSRSKPRSRTSRPRRRCSTRRTPPRWTPSRRSEADEERGEEPSRSEAEGARRGRACRGRAGRGGAGPETAAEAQLEEEES